MRDCTYSKDTLALWNVRLRADHLAFRLPENALSPLEITITDMSKIKTSTNRNYD